ncbi:glycosyltransferase [Aeromonas salmonicida]|uniref:glycosyltransferase n=1 Tax=Aeromonas salmonicida TaxID=645 RepID=UPI00285A8C6C|nr:hypothetical protein [Aeromonas salmonicida]MDR7018916.1 glycosyltransferase involved in cell wall biosynthesis [Aeromonas salmonicida]
MKVLLIGEYSGVHTNLAKNLTAQGHIVTTVSDGDGYKNFPRDVDLAVSETGFFKSSIVKNILYYLGIKGIISYFKKRAELDKLKGFDIVQLINPAPITAYSSIANYMLLRKLKKNNGKFFLCALGDDYYWVKLCLSGKLKYSPLDKCNLLTCKKYLFSLKYIYGIGYKKLNDYAVNISEKIIPGLIDYKNAYAWSDKVTEIIGISIGQEQFLRTKDIYETQSFIRNRNVINVFHGWQKGKDLRKGNDILDATMLSLKERYPDKINYEVVSGLTYDEYIKRFDSADIFLDQLYSYDRGVNGILGMANGKLVVSGFEDSPSIQGLVTQLGINGTPDQKTLFDALEFIINNQDIRYQIVKNSISYILDNHSPNIVVNKYIDVWIR